MGRLTRPQRSALYRERRLGAGYPNLEATSSDYFTTSLEADTTRAAHVHYLWAMLGRLIDIDSVRTISIVGCGPRPETARLLLERGYAVTAVEPVRGYVDRARSFLDAANAAVLLGSAERLPMDDECQDIVLMESVLEHVDSPTLALQEAFRVLVPGGVVFVTTTNQLQLSSAGRCAEFNIRFFNWLPALVKESYVHEHLHYRPELANYAPRPAVHWFTYARLCALGRTAGFGRFYSHLDLLQPDDRSVRARPLKRRALPWVQRRPWLRALALSQVGGTIFMWKRDASVDRPGLAG